MTPIVVNALGTAAALLTITSFVPQIVKIARERNASSVSLRMYAMTVAAFVLWTIYGVATRAWPVAAANTASLVCAATALFLKWKFRDGSAKASD